MHTVWTIHGNALLVRSRQILGDRGIREGEGARDCHKGQGKDRGHLVTDSSET